jgi:hypothetical protein
MVEFSDATTDRMLKEHCFAASRRLLDEREKLVRACIRPKPRWVPYRLWVWALSKLLFLAEFNCDLPRSNDSNENPRFLQNDAGDDDTDVDENDDSLFSPDDPPRY